MVHPHWAEIEKEEGSVDTSDARLRSCRTIKALAITMMLAGTAHAQTLLAPVVDRWLYPFASSAGNRATVATFGTGGDGRFDDRDSEFYLAFNTQAAAPSGYAPGMYRIQSAVLKLQIAEDQVFVYDPTQDAFNTYPLNGIDPGNDPDAGRPIEVFAAAYRNGFTVQTFTDTSPFKPGQAFSPPWAGVRNAYPIDFGGSNGAARDVSSNIRQGFEVTPLAVGQADVTPGASVPAGTVFSFALDASSSGSRGYLQTALSGGRVALAVTSMQVATEFGSGPIVYPVFFTSKAQAFGFADAQGPVLELAATVCPADYNTDGTLNLDDLSDYITDFYTQPAIPGGLQTAAPQYADTWVGYATPCPNAPDAPTPYATDAYRVRGYRVGYSADGSNACPAQAGQNFPNLDNLSEFITDYYARFTAGDC